MDMKDFEEFEENDENYKFQEGNFAVVKFTTKKDIFSYYVGRVNK